MARKPDADGIQVVATNRKARHDYEVLETFEAGMVLVGTEVKSLRDGKCSLVGAFAAIEAGEMFLRGMEIPEYSHGNLLNHEPGRKRKLLLHKKEIRKIEVRSREKGFTLVPLKVYFRQGRAKVEVALVKGKKLHDHRQTQARKEAEREMARAVGRRRRR